MGSMGRAGVRAVTSDGTLLEPNTVRGASQLAWSRLVLEQGMHGNQRLTVRSMLTLTRCA